MFVNKSKQTLEVNDRLTMANSGSRLGSTPNSNPVPAAPDPPAAPEGPAPAPASPMASSGMPMPRSPARMGEEMSMSERRCGPGGTDTRCLPVRIAQYKKGQQNKR